ncbi:MAG: TRCF domain-containing protein [Alphaproteobacteria bacterium]
MSVLIPESYIEDLPLRLSSLSPRRRAGDAGAIESFAAELTDRFGTPPEEVEHLLAVLSIKILCKQAGIARVDAGPKGIVLAFRDNIFAAPDKLLAHIARQPKRIRFKPDQTLFVAHETFADEERLKAVLALAGEMQGLVVSAISPGAPDRRKRIKASCGKVRLNAQAFQNFVYRARLEGPDGRFDFRLPVQRGRYAACGGIRQR